MATILLIDHDKSASTPLANALVAAGHRVVEVTEGADGLQQARADAPDCIVLAVELSGLSGYSVCNKLKRDPQTGGIPLLLSSSQATPETFAEHSRLRTHAEAYVHKPYDVQSVLGTLASLLGQPAPSLKGSSAEPAQANPQEAALGAGNKELPQVRFGQEPSAVALAQPLYATQELTEQSLARPPARDTEVSEPDRALGSGGQLTTEADLLLESAVDTQNATRIYQSLPTRARTKTAPQDLIAAALGDLSKAQAKSQAAQEALALASTADSAMGGDSDAVRSAVPAEDGAGDKPTEGQAGPAFGPQGFNAARHGADGARLAELERRCAAAEAARDEALAQLKAQEQMLAQVRKLLQHAHAP